MTRPTVVIAADDLERLVELAARAPEDLQENGRYVRQIRELEGSDRRFVRDIAREHHLHTAVIG